MRHTLQLERADARAILEAAHQAADARGDAPDGAHVSIAIVDGGGQLLMLERRDGASVSSAETAVAKARMAALNGKATADQELAINGDRPALLQLAGVFGQPAVAMTGGLPLLAGGVCIGAIGVSGMTPSIDLAIAQAGQAAFLRLLPDPKP